MSLLCKSINSMPRFLWNCWFSFYWTFNDKILHYSVTLTPLWNHLVVHSYSSRVFQWYQKHGKLDYMVCEILTLQSNLTKLTDLIVKWGESLALVDRSRIKLTMFYSSIVWWSSIRQLSWIQLKTRNMKIKVS
jgi:hypothetical protein